MKKRVLVAGMAHESDSFNPIVAGAADFPIFRGEEMLRRRVENDATTGILDTLEAQGYQIIPALFTHAVPNGLVDREFYLSVKAEILDAARRALREGPIDAVTLELHGSMTVKDYGEAEGPLLEELRALLPGVPILSALDMHATMTAKMHRNCDGFAAFQQAPHTDQYETGVKAAKMTIAALEEGVKPASAWVKVPLLVAGEQSATDVEPMVSLIGAFRESEKKPGVLAASCLMGYPWCDNPDCGAGAYVTAVDQPTADAEALRLGKLMWEARERFSFQTEAYPEKEAVDVALAAALEGGEGPVYLSDSGDNPTGGSSSDCTGLLRCLLEDDRTLLLPEAVLYGGIYDPQAALACRGRVGEELTLTFGAKFDQKTTRPITATGKVMAFRENWQGGAAALFRTHNVDIVLAEKHIGYTDPGLFAALGREAGKARLVAVKLGYLTPGHAALTGRAILALSRGSTNEALETLPYEKIPRPIFPLDREFDFTPRLEK